MKIITELVASKPVAPAFVLLGVFWGAFAAYVPEIKNVIQASDAAFGTAMLIAAIGAVMAMWLAPKIDTVLPRYAIVVLMILGGGLYFVPTHATSIAVFTLGMVFMSSISGTLDVVMNARLSQIETEKSISLMGLNHAVFSFGYAAAALIAGLARGQGVTFGQFAIGVLCLAVVLTLLAGPSDPVDDDAEPEAKAVKVTFGLVLIPGLIIMIAFMTEQATEAWSALHIERVLNVSAELSALGPAILGLTMGIGRLAGHYGMKSRSEPVVVAGGALITAFGAFLAAWSNVSVGVYAGFALLGAGVSVMVPMIFSYVSKSTPKRLRTQVISRVSVIGYAGFFLGPPMMGFLSELGTLTLSFSVIGALLLSIPILLWSERRN